MNLRVIILLVLGMSISFSVILSVFVLSRHREARQAERLPVLRAPTAVEIAQSRRPRAPTPPAKDGNVIEPNDQTNNELELDGKYDTIVAGFEDWNVDHLELKRTEPTQMDVREPSKHLDRMQAELLQQVQALRKSRDLMLSELAHQFEGMTTAQIAAELQILDNESAAIALAKLSTAKRGAVLRQVDDKRAKILGRLANSYASKNRAG